MGRLTREMRELVLTQRLGYHATVCADGTPNLSPKGTTSVYDDGHLFLAEIRSPKTIANLAANPTIEVNVVDPSPGRLPLQGHGDDPPRRRRLLYARHRSTA
jgi:predicted pyridoxine 5'-phosphate oxidase superfamily flavin-nucleotide-binding protein